MIFSEFYLGFSIKHLGNIFSLHSFYCRVNEIFLSADASASGLLVISAEPGVGEEFPLS